MEKKFNSLQEFYPYYLSEHQNVISRALHFIGTSCFWILLYGVIMHQQWHFLWYMPVVGYGFAWIGHAFFERNKPATFSYPLYSLCSDFIMYWHILTGQIGEKLEEAKKRYP